MPGQCYREQDWRRDDWQCFAWYSPRSASRAFEADGSSFGWNFADRTLWCAISEDEKADVLAGTGCAGWIQHWLQRTGTSTDSQGQLCPDAGGNRQQSNAEPDGQYYLHGNDPVEPRRFRSQAVPSPKTISPILRSAPGLPIARAATLIRCRRSRSVSNPPNLSSKISGASSA